MIKKSSLFLIPVFIIFSMFFVSAGALNIVGNSSYELNKTFGQDYSFTFVLKNTAANNFYNITSSNEDVLVIDKIPVLATGENITVNATIISNSNFNGDIRLRGFYTAELGDLNQTHQISFGNGDISRCDFSIYSGDKITWTNKYAFDVDLKKSTTNQLIKTMAPNEIFSQKFTSPQVFTYETLRYGWTYDGPCTITVLDTAGYINNPESDAKLGLKISISYPPTTLSINNPISSYTIDFNGQQEGLFTITNTGTEVARQISLTGDWMTFTENYFDLGVGASKVIGYNIKPIRFITQTSQTNKNYTLDILAKGNFPESRVSMDIFVPYAEIKQRGDYNITYDDLKAFVEYCTSNPDDPICPDTEIEFIYLNDSEKPLNFTMTQRQWEQFIRFTFDSKDELDIRINNLLELIDTLNKTVYDLKLNELNQTNSLVGLEDSQNKNVNSSTTSFILVISFLIFIDLAALAVVYRKKRLRSEWEAMK